MSREVEKTIHQVVSISRWLLAPMYLGVGLTLVILLVVFVRDFFRLLPELFQMSGLQVALAGLSMAGILLLAHVILAIVQTASDVFTRNGSAADPTDNLTANKPHRMDFGRLRTTLFGGAIAMALLFMLQTLARGSQTEAADPVDGFATIAIILGVLVTSALVLAVADWFASLAHRNTRDEG